MLHKKRWENEQKTKDTDGIVKTEPIEPQDAGWDEKSGENPEDCGHKSSEETGQPTASNSRQVLQEILNEKKKMLLQNEEVVNFLRTKIGFED